MSLYQSFAFLWHLNRGDVQSARIVASLPPECFAAFDAILRAAFAYGAEIKSKQK